LTHVRLLRRRFGSCRYPILRIGAAQQQHEVAAIGVSILYVQTAATSKSVDFVYGCDDKALQVIVCIGLCQLAWKWLWFSPMESDSTWVMTTSDSIVFETRGPMRGACGHRHPDVESALRCLRDDQAACNAAGAFSDRQIVPVHDAPRGERFAVIRALHEAEGLYLEGAAAQALQRLDNLPEIQALAEVMDIADVQRWINRAAVRIRREASAGPLPPAPVTACLRAAANIIARAV
jgi:hypothetical protein